MQKCELTCNRIYTRDHYVQENAGRVYSVDCKAENLCFIPLSFPEAELRWLLTAGFMVLLQTKTV
jgi:hypothetical protein